jgi:glycosyltransferase involved in cell wall biosynthesis
LSNPSKISISKGKLLRIIHNKLIWMKLEKIDIVIPTRNKVNNTLLNSLKHMPGSGEVIVTRENPLSIARKHAVLKAKTEWVAMIDDDIFLPNEWLSRVAAEIAPNVGAVATVALQGNKHIAAYDRVIGNVVKLHKVDTSPHINNVLIRRTLLVGYNPPPLFFGEDHHLKKFIEKSGYVWKVIPYVGAVHLGSSKNHVTLGVAYRRYGHYSLFQLARRMVARFIFTPYAALANFSFATFMYLNKINVEFIAGWAKESAREKTRN